MKSINLTLLGLLALGACGGNSLETAPVSESQGLQGIKGERGARGYAAVISSSSFSTSVACIAGGINILTATDTNENGILDSEDSNILASTLCNGVNGVDGQNGQDGQDGQDAVLPPFAPVAILDPCGDHPSIFDEVLLKLANGQVLASFSDNVSGLNTRFSLIGPGTYRTTDGSSCLFTIDSNGNLL